MCVCVYVFRVAVYLDRKFLYLYPLSTNDRIWKFLWGGLGERGSWFVVRQIPPEAWGTVAILYVHEHFELLKSFVLFKHKSLIEMVYNSLTPKFDARRDERGLPDSLQAIDPYVPCKRLVKRNVSLQLRVENQFEQGEESRLRASPDVVEHRPWHPNFTSNPISLKLLSQATILH